MTTAFVSIWPYYTTRQSSVKPITNYSKPVQRYGDRYYKHALFSKKQIFSQYLEPGLCNQKHNVIKVTDELRIIYYNIGIRDVSHINILQ